jgi:hypothetical protein
MNIGAGGGKIYDFTFYLAVFQIHGGWDADVDA